MSGIGELIGALMAGLLLGALFFGGLWWTVRQGLLSRTPALWFGLSAVVRTGVLFTGLYFIARGSLVSLLVCVLGLLIARAAVTRLTRLPRVGRLAG